MLVFFCANNELNEFKTRIDFDDGTFFVFEEGKRSIAMLPFPGVEFPKEEDDRFKKFMFHKIKDRLSIEKAEATGEQYVKFNKQQ